MIPSLVRDAFRLAEEERPGAVHLELPEDVAFEEV
jgi:acetolactate synthase-1/2/3 large subunit